MEDKKEFKEDRFRIKKELCSQLLDLRLNKGITMTEAAYRCKLPSYLVESLELYGLFNAHITDLQRLANIYGRRIQIRLVAEEEL